ncbi:MAG: 4'-phosphopantetheinyl transferase family protein [Candidatus Electrothrix sp. YB6]
MDIYFFFPTVVDCFGLTVRTRQDTHGPLALVDLAQVEYALQDSNGYLERATLSDAEQIYFRKFRYLKRRKEWLGGRIAVKAALQAGKKTDDVRQLSVLPNRYGLPIVGGGHGKTIDFSVSISHSGGYAVALAAEGQTACGIDLQRISDKLSSLTKYFASDRELTLLAGQSDYDRHTWLTMLWAVKECLKKSILHDQSVVFSETEVETILPVNGYTCHFTCTVQGQDAQAEVYLLPPYVLAISQGSSQVPNHA